MMRIENSSLHFPQVSAGIRANRWKRRRVDHDLRFSQDAHTPVAMQKRGHREMVTTVCILIAD